MKINAGEENNGLLLGFLLPHFSCNKINSRKSNEFSVDQRKTNDLRFRLVFLFPHF
jgi:hypothetical protein